MRFLSNKICFNNEHNHEGFGVEYFTFYNPSVVEKRMLVMYVEYRYEYCI